ncbi:polymorphic toxin-type HINT domain-containing protein, partial [Paenibacillus tarimensis]
FWVEGKGWVFADELQVGDKLQKADGSNLTIDKVEFVKLGEPVTVYNFTVADFHTYYVTDIGIWVHNTNGCLPDSRWIQRSTYKELQELGLNEQFARAMKKGLANARQGDNGIILLSKNEQIIHKGNLYTFKIKVAKASNHLRVYGRIDDNGNLIFDYITKGKK